MEARRMHRAAWLGLVSVALFGLATPALADWNGKGKIKASIASSNSENQAANATLEQKTDTLTTVGLLYETK
jgi:hypothetical protein